MSKLRLDRFLAECGIGTRSEVKSYIKKGRVTVNDKPVSESNCKIDTDADKVKFDGIELEYEEFRYFMLNKPAGCVSATRDGISSTVLDMLDGENTRDLFPVGRLDKDTEGLLLITNDGQLGHRLLSPKKHVDKTYLAAVSQELGEEQLGEFESGLDIGDDTPTMPARIKRLDMDGAASTEGSALENFSDFENKLAVEAVALKRDDWDIDAVYEVIIHEGRYHQIKRMFEALDSEVLYLKRVAMGAVVLDEELEPGEYRRLTAEELALLRS